MKKGKYRYNNKGFRKPKQPKFNSKMKDMEKNNNFVENVNLIRKK